MQDIKKQINEIVDKVFVAGMLYMADRSTKEVKQSQVDKKAEKAKLLALLTQSVEEIIGEDLGYSESPTNKEYWDKVNRNIEVMNALRAEQRARLATLIKQ